VQTRSKRRRRDWLRWIGRVDLRRQQSLKTLRENVDSPVKLRELGNLLVFDINLASTKFIFPFDLSDIS
jgi:hypothetical protein